MAAKDLVQIERKHIDEIIGLNRIHTRKMRKQVMLTGANFVFLKEQVIKLQHDLHPKAESTIVNAALDLLREVI